MIPSASNRCTSSVARPAISSRIRRVSAPMLRPDQFSLPGVVDTALYEGAFSFMELHVPAYGAVGHVANRSGHKLPSSTPNNLYPTGDGQHVLIAAHAQSLFKRLCATMGNPELAEDERFKDAASRAANEIELDGNVAAWCGRHTLEELEQALHGVESRSAGLALEKPNSPVSRKLPSSVR